MITLLVLAAGASRRMNRPKLTLPWGDSTVLDHVLRQAAASSADSILLVTGGYAAESAAIAAAHGVPTIHNPDYETGEMVSSLQVALRHLPPNTEAVLVVLADMPLLSSHHFDAVVNAYRSSDALVVAPTVNGQRGHPVLFDAATFDALLALPPGSAPRAAVQAFGDRLHLIDAADDAPIRDIDTPDGYLTLYARQHGGRAVQVATIRPNLDNAFAIQEAGYAVIAAANDGADVIVLPPLFFFENGRIDHAAVGHERSGEALAALQEALTIAQSDAVVVTSLVGQFGPFYRHLGAVIGRNGPLHAQPQRTPDDNHPWITQLGSEQRVLSLPWGKLTLFVGNDVVDEASWADALIPDVQLVVALRTGGGFEPLQAACASASLNLIGAAAAAAPGLVAATVPRNSQNPFVTIIPSQPGVVTTFLYS